MQLAGYKISFSAISIHALREESDDEVALMPRSFVISIHALREESDPITMRIDSSPRRISIHALREESDPYH